MVCSTSDIFRMFFTFDNESTGTILNSKIDQMDEKIEGFKNIADRTLGQQDSDIHLTQAMIEKLKNHFEMELQSEKKFREKFQRKLTRLERKVETSSNRLLWDVLMIAALIFFVLVLGLGWLKA